MGKVRTKLLQCSRNKAPVVKIAIRSGFEIAPTEGIDADVGVVTLVKQVVDSNERRDDPIA